MSKINSEILILGGGPIACTIANKLVERHMSVIMLIPKESISFKNSKNSFTKLSKYSNSGKLYGNQIVWGNQHDIDVDEVFLPNQFQTIKNLSFDIQKLQPFKQEAVKLGWLFDFNEKKYLKLNLFKDFQKNRILKLNNINPYPKLDQRIHVIEINPSFLHFQKGSSSSINQIRTDDMTFDFDHLLIACGGLSNVYYAEKISKLLNLDSSLIGAGYVNHPKKKLGIIKFTKYTRIRKKFFLRNSFIFESFSTKNNDSKNRELSVAFRLWPSTRQINQSILPRIMLFFGYAKECELIFYYEMPQLLSSVIKVIDFLQFEMNIEFANADKSAELVSYFNNKETKLFDMLRQSKLVSEVTQLDMIHLEDLRQDSNHHIGGTRMGNSIENGVVDEDCRMFGVQNVFFYGTSILPSGRSEHPTYLSLLFALKSVEKLIQEKRK